MRTIVLLCSMLAACDDPVAVEPAASAPAGVATRSGLPAIKPPGGGGRWNRLAIEPSQPSHGLPMRLWATGDVHGIWRASPYVLGSTPAWGDWSLIDDGLGSLEVHDVAFGPEVTVGVSYKGHLVFAATAGGLYWRWSDDPTLRWNWISSTALRGHAEMTSDTYERIDGGAIGCAPVGSANPRTTITSDQPWCYRDDGAVTVQDSFQSLLYVARPEPTIGRAGWIFAGRGRAKSVDNGTGFNNQNGTIYRASVSTGGVIGAWEPVLSLHLVEGSAAPYDSYGDPLFPIVGPQVFHLELDPATGGIYAATDMGLYRTTNAYGAATSVVWHTVGNTLDRTVTAGTSAYAATAGASWSFPAWSAGTATSCTSCLPYRGTLASGLVETLPNLRSVEVTTPAVTPSPGRLSVALWDNDDGTSTTIAGVYYSDDGGVNWTRTTDDDLTRDSMHDAAWQYNDVQAFSPTDLVVGVTAASGASAWGSALRAGVGTLGAASVPSLSDPNVRTCATGDSFDPGYWCAMDDGAPAHNENADAWDVQPEVKTSSVTSWLASDWTEIVRMSRLGTGPVERLSLVAAADPAYTLAWFPGWATTDLCDEYSSSTCTPVRGSSDFVAYETIGPSNLVVPTRVAELSAPGTTVQIIGASDTTGYLLTVDRGDHWFHGSMLIDDGVTARPGIPVVPYSGTPTERYGRYALASDGEFAAVIVGGPGSQAIVRIDVASWDTWTPVYDTVTDAPVPTTLDGFTIHGVFPYPQATTGAFAVLAEDGTDWKLFTVSAADVVTEVYSTTTPIRSFDVLPSYTDHGVASLGDGTVIDIDLTAATSTSVGASFWTLSNVDSHSSAWDLETVRVILDPTTAGPMVLVGLAGTEDGAHNIWHGPTIVSCRKTAGTWCSAWTGTEVAPSSLFAYTAEFPDHDARETTPHYFVISDFAQDPADSNHVVASAAGYGENTGYGPIDLYDTGSVTASTAWPAVRSPLGPVSALSWLPDGDLYLSGGAGFVRAN